MTTIRIADYFTHNEDSGRYSLGDDHPDWLYDACRDAHDGEWPNDWRWETCYDIACAIDEAVAYDSFDPDDTPYEIADRLTDVYNNDLARWLADDVSRGSYVDEAAAEFGVASDDVFTMIRHGQYACIEQMAQILCEALSSQRD